MKRVNSVVGFCAGVVCLIASAASADVPARARMVVEVNRARSAVEVERARIEILFKGREDGGIYRVLMDQRSKRAGVRRARNVGDLTCPPGLGLSLGGIIPADDFVARVVGRSFRSQYRTMNRSVAGEDDVLAALTKAKKRFDCGRLNEYVVRSERAEILGREKLLVYLDPGRGRPMCSVESRSGRYCMEDVPLMLSFKGREDGGIARECGRVGIEEWWGGADELPRLYDFELRLEEELAIPQQGGTLKSIFIVDGPPGMRIPGDHDADGDVDGDDYLTMWKGTEVYSSCYTGPGRGPITARCLAADMDDDNDVDGHDWTMFRAAWTGPGNPPDAIPPGRDAYELMIVIIIIGGNSSIPPLPAGFFGPGSDPFEGTVQFIPSDYITEYWWNLSESPLCIRESPTSGTIRESPTYIRESPLAVMIRESPTMAELPGPTTVPIELVQLNLVSKEPIRVTYGGGRAESFFDVFVTIRESPTSMGQMTVWETGGLGDSFFDITYQIEGKMSFAPVLGANDYPADSFFDLFATVPGPELFVKEMEPGVQGCEEEAYFYAKKKEEIEMVFDGGASGYMTMRAPLQTGGCCLPGGECVTVADDDCDGMRGEYSGDDVSCYPSPCQPLWGACCYGDPVPHMCTVTTHANCDLLIGTWHGGYDCRDVCPRNGIADICDTTAAVCEVCCIPDGTCRAIPKEQRCGPIEDPDDCAAMGGMPTSGDSCDPNPCPAAQGGCCSGGGLCEKKEEAECTGGGGTYQGDGTDCYPNPCYPGEGACCYGDPPHGCVMTDENTCLYTYNGTWHVGYDCRDECPLNGIPDVCDTTTPYCAVCCMPSGTCVEREYEDCMALGGEPKPALACAPNTCPAPQGGCCGGDGMCEEKKEKECMAGGGIYQGPGSGCGGGYCTVFETACCLPNGDCMNTTYNDCVTLYGGFPQGPSTNCFLPIVVCQPLKWSQPPTYSPASPSPDCFWGWDEMSHYNCCKIMADDWRCATNKPISDIHWWGSYIGWIDPLPPGPPDAPRFFRIGIWKDVPVSAAPNCCQCWMMTGLTACSMGEFDEPYCRDVLGQGWDFCEWHPDAYCQVDDTCQGAFSHPGELLREWIVPRESLNEQWVGCDFHPDHPSPDACFRYDFGIPEGQWFYQDPSGDPTIYWVSIAAWYDDMPPGPHPWGWKTREHFFNDDAVAIVEPRAPIPGDQYIRGYPLETPDGISWDMAFVLTTPPTEACCFVDGTCLDGIPQDCLAIDGIPQGPGTECTVPEACCLPDGTCTMVDPLCCDEMSGIPQGPFSQCSQYPEACCLEDGSCVMVDPLCCDELGGILLEPGSVCAGEIQACCLAETGVCVMADVTCCDMLMGGAPQGSGTVCTVPEACCFGNGSCVNVDPLCCDDMGGVPQGHWTECTWSQACCIVDDGAGNARCIDVDPYCCDEMAGTAQGLDTNCVDTVRACCLPDGSCRDVDPVCCDDIGVPSPSNEPVCLGDVNGNGIDDACEPPPPKWVQLPDLTRNGVDIQLGPDAAASRVIADDFECTQTGPITDVHLFGSWKHDIVGSLTSINLSIWSDDPVGPGGSDPNNLWSHPDQMLWARDFGSNEFTMTPYATVAGGEWWWDAYTNELIPGGDTAVWRVDIRINPAEAFRQGGSPQDPLIYWLAVRVENGMWGEFGWKTRRWPDHYNDDAVWDYGSELPRFWRELRYPPGHPYHGLELDSIDMAFVITTGCPLANPVGAEQPVVAKNRYLTFVPGNAGALTALRVTLADMPPPFEWFEGCRLWVGTPFDVSELAGKPDATPPTFKAANLQTDPYCMDWGTIPLLYVFENEIVPRGVYNVQAIDCLCDNSVETNYAVALPITMSKWGDIVGANNQQPPNNVVDFNDIAAVVDKFKNLSGAPRKSQADIAPNTPDKIVDFVDIPSVVDAFRGRAYPYTGPDECPYRGARIGNYQNGGCKTGKKFGGSAAQYPCGEDGFELAVNGNTLQVMHKNATYNCCPDDIAVSLTVQGDTLELKETENLTNPCFCLCCYDVESTVVDLLPGQYLVRYCWYDYETGLEQCYTEAIVLP